MPSSSQKITNLIVQLERIDSRGNGLLGWHCERCNCLLQLRSQWRHDRLEEGLACLQLCKKKKKNESELEGGFFLNKKKRKYCHEPFGERPFWHRWRLKRCTRCAEQSRCAGNPVQNFKLILAQVSHQRMIKNKQSFRNKPRGKRKQSRSCGWWWLQSCRSWIPRAFWNFLKKCVVSKKN